MKRFTAISIVILFMLQVFSGMNWGYEDTERRETTFEGITSRAEESFSGMRIRAADTENDDFGGSWFDGFNDGGSVEQSDNLTLEDGGVYQTDVGFVALWHFDEGAGNTTSDSSGNGNDGIIHGDENWTDGVAGNALKFDGQDDYIDIPTIDIGTNKVTLEAWVKLTFLPNNIPGSFRSIYDTVGEVDSYILYEDKGNNELRFKITDADGTTEKPGIASTQLDTVNWHHIVGVYDGSAGTASIYLDGILIDQHTNAALTGNVKVQDGFIGSNEGSTGFFNGSIDEMRLYSRDLKDYEIVHNYEKKCDLYFRNASQTSTEITLPAGMNWDSLSLDKIESANASITVSVLGAITDQTIRGFSKREERNIDLADLNEQGVTSIQLKAYFSGDGTATSTLDSWGVEWVKENTWRDSFTGDGKFTSHSPIDEHTVGYWNFNDGTARDLAGDNDGTHYGNTRLLMNFDEGEGQETNDESNYDNNGQLGNSGTADDNDPSWTSEGIHGGALSFDGVNDYVDCGNDASLDITDEITVEAWIYPRSWGSYGEYGFGRIIEKGTFAMYLHDTASPGAPDHSLFILLKTGGENRILVSHADTIELNTWQHVAFSYNGSKRYLYIDGIQQNYMFTGGKPSGSLDSEISWELGIGNTENQDRAFNGTIDEVGVYSRALTYSEIQSHYTSKRAQLCDVVEGPQGQGKALKFDGVDDYVDCGEHPSLQITGDLTLSCWAKYDTLGDQNNLIVQGKGNLDGGSDTNIIYSFTIQSDRKLKAFWEYGNGNNVPLPSTNVADIDRGEWHHYTMVRDTSNKEVTFYIDGVQLGEAVSYINGPEDGSSTPLQIGGAWDCANNDGPNHVFYGVIDEVQISDVTRTPEEIREASQSGISIRGGQVQLAENGFDQGIGSDWLQAVANAQWSGRERHKSVVFDNKLWVLGGYGVGWKNDVWYSNDGITWEQATPNAQWSARDAHQSVVFENKLWVIGGTNFDGKKNDVWYSNDGVTWEQATPNAQWDARGYHKSVVFNDKLWVIGGFNGTHVKNDVWCSNNGVNWTQTIDSAPWRARSGHTSVVFNDKLWVIGGIDNEVWSSNDGINWTQAPGAAQWSERYDHTSVVFKNKLWVIGGNDSNNLKNDIWYSTDGVNWSIATSAAQWSPRERQTSVVFDNKLWVIGGLNAGRNRKNDVWYSQIPYYHNATLLSENINLLKDYALDTLHFKRNVPLNTYLNISIHDALTDDILYQEYNNSAEGTIDLSPLDLSNHTAIYLKAYLRSNATMTPVLSDWSLNWTEKPGEPDKVPPELTQSLPSEIPVMEDTPQMNITYLALYFNDIYSTIQPPTYAIQNLSDEENITLALNDSRLDVTYLAENWTGTVQVIANCTNMHGLSTPSNKFNITVTSVNDAPLTELISPLEGGVVPSTEVTLEWKGIDADNAPGELLFDLYFGNNSTPPLKSENITGTTATVTDLTDGDTYYWCVIARDGTLTGPCLNGTWNFTVDMDITVPEVELNYPTDQGIINTTYANLSWSVLNETEGIIYHVYFGQEDGNLTEVGITIQKWYPVIELLYNKTYYWKVIPVAGALQGRCLSGTWRFSVQEDFIPVYDITAELDVTEIRIKQGQKAMFNITLANNGNIPTLVDLKPSGPISGVLEMKGSVLVPLGGTIIVKGTITDSSSFKANIYELPISITYLNETLNLSLSINITPKDIPPEDDDTGDDDDDDGTEDDEDKGKIMGLDLWVWIVIVGGVVLLFIVRYLVIRRRDAEDWDDEDEDEDEDEEDEDEDDDEEGDDKEEFGGPSVGPVIGGPAGPAVLSPETGLADGEEEMEVWGSPEDEPETWETGEAGLDGAEEISPTIRKLIPGYTLVSKLGTGGFATVYKAIGAEGEKVAIKLPKFMDSTVDSSVLKKFKEESDIWKKLKHKGVVKFYEGDIRPVPYMAIEYMEGGNLLEKLKKGKMPVNEAISHIMEILSGMAYAHRMASVHRDIKPENILFTLDERPKISDWGIGKFMASESVSKTVGAKGTLAYSSPEQISPENFGEIDWSTDVFQLGIVFYEMLTGENPFMADDPVTIMSRLVSHIPVPPSSLRVGIPHEMDFIILRALEKEKVRRFSSADSMFEKLKEALKDRMTNIEHYKDMLKAALADGTISPDEEVMLRGFKKRFNISEEDDEEMRREMMG